MMLAPRLMISWLLVSPPRTGGLTCKESPLSALPYCDASRPIAERVRDLLPRLDAGQRIAQTAMVGPAIPELGIEAINFGGEALHGLWSTCVTYPLSAHLKCPTQFATPVTLGASFNRRLWQAVADVASTEARALYSFNRKNISGTTPAKSLEGALGLTYYAPNVNIIRDARWGRAEEVPSEDPNMNGAYARAFVTGFQSGVTGTKDTKYLKAVAVVKHYLAYSLEYDSVHGVDRHAFNALVSERDIIESYTPAFEEAVQAGAAGIMCSYNAVNGEPSCTNEELLNDLLRGKFGFVGVVATDCGALEDAHLHHKRYATEVETVVAAVRAGVDSNCGTYMPTALPWALGNGSLKESDLDALTERLLTMRFTLGLFEPDHPDVPSFSLDDVDSPAHRMLAIESARQGIVLLQNNPSAATGTTLLPISSSFTKIAMIGPGANLTRGLLAGYHGTPPSEVLMSPLVAMRELWPNGPAAVSYSVGCSVNRAEDKEDNTTIARAVAMAEKVDIVVVALALCGTNYNGEDPSGVCGNPVEAEGVDRPSLLLPGRQLDLLMQVVATKKPVVLVMMNAGPVDISWAKDNVAAILWAGYGGQSASRALAEVLLGMTTPGGALPYTVYPQLHAELAPFWDMGMRPNRTTGNPGRTYRFLDTTIVQPLWRFGFGLSYTSFSIRFVEVPMIAVGDESTSWIVQVHNSGPKRVGDVVVVCYVSAVSQTVVSDPPLRSLFDFARVSAVMPGEYRLVPFQLTARGRSLVTASGDWVTPEGIFGVECEAGGVETTGVSTLTVVKQRGTSDPMELLI